MSKRYVVALGGNAILTDDPTAKAQQEALKVTASQLVALIKAGHELIITHGNGPQVGNLLLQQVEADSEKNPAMPLDTVGAMTQGEIGFWMVSALTEELNKSGIKKSVAAVVTRTVVDKADKAFSAPTKPIGPFYSAEELELEKSNHEDWTFVEDAGRGFRRVVPSPIPTQIVESEVIEQLVDNGVLLVAAGGGGIPVVETEIGYDGVEAVIDKDFSAAKLAELVKADEFIILTAVDNVFVNYNKPDQKKLEKVSKSEMKDYLAEEQFAAGSMKPKVEAALSFVERTGRAATITSLDNLENFLATGSGTVIIPE
ncbi:MAG: carbamate kinase [Lactovum sp.]